MSALQQPLETVAVLKSNSITIYKAFPRSSKPEQTEAQLANLEKGKAGLWNGFMSPATARKVKGFLSPWLDALQFAREKAGKTARLERFPTFVTLTLPAEQMHSDYQIKRDLLNRFVGWLKNKCGVQEYFWRAEPQENGNIHFHLICDRYIHYSKIRLEWNKILDDHGYIEMYRRNQEAFHQDGFKLRKDLLKFWPEEKQKAAYATGKAENWSNPNSTDIHKIGNVKNLAAYVVKYCCKTEQDKRTIKGRIWGSSDNLRKCRAYQDTLAISQNYTEFQNPEVADYCETVEKMAEKVISDEYLKIIILPKGKTQEQLLREFAPGLHSSYLDHYKNILLDLYPAPIFKAAPAVQEMVPF